MYYSTLLIANSLSVQVLGDVSEEYSPFRSVANGGTEGKRKRRRRKGTGKTVDSQTCSPQPPTGGVPPATAKGGRGTLTGGIPPAKAEGEGGSGTLTDVATAEGEGGMGQHGKLTRQLRQLFIRGDNVVMVAPKGQRSDNPAAKKGQSTKCEISV